MDELERRFPDPPLYPRTPVHKTVGLLLELYADEFMLLPRVHYRWSFPESAAKALAQFVAFSGDPGTATTFAESVQMFTRLLGASPETAPAIEAHTVEILDALEATPYSMWTVQRVVDTY